MSDTQISDAVLSRVRKMLAFANDKRGNENETANAAALAQQIIAEYGLELAQLESHTATAADTSRGKVQHDRAAMYAYQRGLMEGIAKTHFCRYFTTEIYAESFGKMRKVKRHVLLGRSINVQAATMIYDYLVDTMDRLLPWQGTDKRGREALLWLEGCSARLVERLAEKRREMQRESEAKRREDEVRSRHPGATSSGTALVLADAYSSEDDFNSDFLAGLEPGTTARRRCEAQAVQMTRAADIDRRTAELKAQGINDDLVFYLARGYSMEDAKRWTTPAQEVAIKVSRPETDAQRRKREQKAENEQYRRHRQYERNTRRTRETAYQAGHAKGVDIGLNQQVSGTDKKRIG